MTCDCTAEALAAGQAFIVLNAAQLDYDTKWMAWMDCEMECMMGEPLTAEFSTLTEDQRIKKLRGQFVSRFGRIVQAVLDGLHPFKQSRLIASGALLASQSWAHAGGDIPKAVKCLKETVKQITL